MHKITVLAIAASLSGAPLCDAHAGSNTSGVFGFLSSNGTFRPVLTETPAPKAAAAATLFTGKLVAHFTFMIGVSSNVPPTASILCGLQASVFGIDPTGVSDVVLETDEATATRSGNKATCEVVIPYTWSLSVPTSDNVTLSGSATAVDTNGRTSSFQLEVIAVPATGTVTTITYSGKL